MGDLNVAVLTVAFGEERMIGANVRQFKKPYLGDNIFQLVLASQRPWRGNHWADRTYEFAKAEGADLVFSGTWNTQADQFNWGLSFLNTKGFDWALIVDVDEFYTPTGIENLLYEIIWTPYDALRAKNMKVYWRQPENLITPDQTDSPIIAIKTNQKFIDKRNANVFSGDSDVTMHHFSYVRDDNEMLKKIESFEHSDEFDKNKWFNNIWKKWPKVHNNLHPVIPHIFGGIMYKPAPTSILDNYYADQRNYIV